MMRFSRYALISTLLALSSACAAPLQILATLPAFAQIASDIGGANIHVSLLQEYPKDPHHFNMTPNQLHQIKQSDYVIGPTEVIQRLPIEKNKGICLARAYSEPELQSSPAFNRLIAIAQEDGYSNSLNPLNDLTHEWISFDAIEIIGYLMTQICIEKDSDHSQDYLQRYHNLCEKLRSLKKEYENKAIIKKNIIYHNDFWLLEEELSQNFGPVLYSCEESGITPETKRLLSQRSGEYTGLIIDKNIPISTISKITSHLECPIVPLATLGDTSQSTSEWLHAILKRLYSEKTESVD